MVRATSARTHHTTFTLIECNEFSNDGDKFRGDRLDRRRSRPRRCDHGQRRAPALGSSPPVLAPATGASTRAPGSADAKGLRHGARACTYAARRGARLITVYLSNGPSSGSSPSKCTIAPAGIFLGFPNCLTDVASTICNAESSANAFRAASSAVLAPPERHEASNTPDRRCPRTSIPWPTS